RQQKGTKASRAPARPGADQYTATLDVHAADGRALRNCTPQCIASCRLAPFDPELLGGQVHQIEASAQLVPFRLSELDAGANQLVGENKTQRAPGDGLREVPGAGESPHSPTALPHQKRRGGLRYVVQKSQGRDSLWPLSGADRGRELSLLVH